MSLLYSVRNLIPPCQRYVASIDLSVLQTGDSLQRHKQAPSAEVIVRVVMEKIVLTASKTSFLERKPTGERL